MLAIRAAREDAHREVNRNSKGQSSNSGGTTSRAGFNFKNDPTELTKDEKQQIRFIRMKKGKNRNLTEDEQAIYDFYEGININKRKKDESASAKTRKKK